MAKPDDKSSTTDWIWLHDALVLAAECFGSAALAKERLMEWLATGKLPWTCVSWKGLDAEGLAEKKREKQEKEDLAQKRRDQGNSTGLVIYSLPSTVYCSGDPRFWSATLRTDWENNAAYEARRHGAQALGVRVSARHMRALLPKVPHENEKLGPQLRRVLQALKKLYPPDGKVPNDVPTAIVQGQVSKELSVDSKNRELAAPSWDTVNRALGRS
jgi:hypothetical protein